MTGLTHESTEKRSLQLQLHRNGARCKAVSSFKFQYFCGYSRSQISHYPAISCNLCFFSIFRNFVLVHEYGPAPLSDVKPKCSREGAKKSKTYQTSSGDEGNKLARVAGDRKRRKKEKKRKRVTLRGGFHRLTRKW